MAKRKTATKKKTTKSKNEPDSTFVLKMVLYLMVGVLWFRLIPYGHPQIPVPVGAILGLLFATHDRFQIDRKLEYVILLLAMFIGFWLPIGFDIYL